MQGTLNTSTRRITSGPMAATSHWQKRLELTSPPTDNPEGLKVIKMRPKFCLTMRTTSPSSWNSAVVRGPSEATQQQRAGTACLDPNLSVGHPLPKRK